jgi:hypothetical protein
MDPEDRASNFDTTRQLDTNTMRNYWVWVYLKRVWVVNESTYLTLNGSCRESPKGDPLDPFNLFFFF